MEFSTSDYLSAVALVVSVGSAYYAKIQSDFARVSWRDDYRAHLSEKHEKYRVALVHADNIHKEEISNLSHAAGDTLTAIVHVFDQFDKYDHKPRYLRHLIHECSEMVYFAFKGQLGWQSGANIMHRLTLFLRVEDVLDPKFKYFHQDAHRQVFENRYFKNENAFQESDVLNDFHFCSLVNQIKERVDSSRTADLLLTIREQLHPFIESLDRIKPRLRETVENIDGLLKESELEHFPLNESPRLYRQLKRKKATLETLSRMYFPKIDRDIADRYYNHTSLCIYICAVLHAIQGFHFWGWNYEF